MKKFTIATLLLLSTLCLGSAVACGGKGGEDSSSSTSVETSTESSSSAGEQSTHSVSFTSGDGYSFETDFSADSAESGETIDFRVNVSAFYTGSPIVYVNDTPAAPKADGSYSVTVEEDIAIRVEGIRKDVSNMLGTGTMEDAFVVSKPIDLLYIAQQVNAGNYRYATGAYILANDIDCKGEELQVIGDMRTDNAVFSGCFSCYADTETGEIERYSISNFTIKTTNVNYVGLFGTVAADPSITSSGLFYGICIDNFTINTSIDETYEESKSMSVGGLIGYSVGANLIMCDATNGTINIVADNSYFSFAGGLIGYQQAYYDTAYGLGFPSEITYSHADVDINILSGSALAAGGITGYMATNYPIGAIASVQNSYSTGTVSGALRTGGIAGNIGQYTVVSNCYATGDSIAKSINSIDNELATTEEYCYAHAGGLVGFAENDSIVHDSYTTGKAYAYAPSGADYAIANAIVGGGYPAGNVSVDSKAYVVDNCVSEVDLSNADFLTQTLGWQKYNWEFTKNEHPTIFYGSTESAITLNVTINYVCVDENGDVTPVKVNGQTSKTQNFFDTSVQSTNVYTTFGDWLLGGLDSYYTADAQNGVSYLSYGYFFDSACTIPVPYSYLPAKNTTLYVGFADPSALVGTYYLTPDSNSETIKLVFDKDGFVTYSDGITGEQVAIYSYDGEKIVIEGARLTRYFFEDGILFDPNCYNYYNFYGKLTENGIMLYDNFYYTESAPLTASKTAPALRGAYYTATANSQADYIFYGDKAYVEFWIKGVYSNGWYTVKSFKNGLIILDNGGVPHQVAYADLKEYDAFKGAWTKSANVNKTYTFDGRGNYEYVYTSYARNGYTSDETVLERATGTYDAATGKFVHDGVEYTMAFNSSGMLEISSTNRVQTFYRENSHQGTWQNNGVTLTLNGINNENKGTALIVYSDGVSYDLVYELDEQGGLMCLYWAHADYWKDQLFGYFMYDLPTHTLTAMLYDAAAETGYTQVSLFVTDEYEGEWICDAPELRNVEFDFNGLGLYGFLYAGVNGELTLIEDGRRTTVSYSLDSALQGKFAYNGKLYQMSYDEDTKAVVLTTADEEAAGLPMLERKDKFANTVFVDMDGNTYTFDGRSNLSTGGILKINNKTQYRYAQNGDAFDVYDNNGAKIGSLTETNSYYALTLNDTQSHLYIENDFMGTWAISGAFASFTIQATDLQGRIRANFKGHNVTMSYAATDMLTFSYRENGMPIEYYVFIMQESASNTRPAQTILVLSESPDLYGEYMICTKADPMFGNWIAGNGMSIRFDGVNSGYVEAGKAELHDDLSGATTTYNYSYTQSGIMLWTADSQNITYYKLDMKPATTGDYTFKNGANSFNLVKANFLYLVTAKDAENNQYFFDIASATTFEDVLETVFEGIGQIKVNGTLKYTYVITASDFISATLELTDVSTGEKSTATLDFSDSSNIIWSFVK